MGILIRSSSSKALDLITSAVHLTECRSRALRPRRRRFRAIDHNQKLDSAFGAVLTWQHGLIRDCRLKFIQPSQKLELLLRLCASCRHSSSYSPFNCFGCLHSLIVLRPWQWREMCSGSPPAVKFNIVTAPTGNPRPSRLYRLRAQQLKLAKSFINLLISSSAMVAIGSA